MTSDANLDRDVRLFVYRFFLEAGRPPVPVETAGRTGVDERAGGGVASPACR